MTLGYVTRSLPRATIAGFIPDARGQRAFEDAQTDLRTTAGFVAGTQAARILTITSSSWLPGASTLGLTADLTDNDEGAGQPFIIGLSATSVVAGAYGGDQAWATFTVDAKGRLTAAASVAFSVEAPLAYDPAAHRFSLTPVPTDLAGVPAGGNPNQRLIKTGAADYDVAWGGSRELSCFAEAPIAASKVILRYVAALAVTIPANLAGWAVKAAANPAASFTVVLAKNGTPIGSITISTAGAVTLATTGGTAVTMAVGDVLTMTCPGAPDASIAGLAITGPALL